MERLLFAAGLAIVGYVLAVFLYAAISQFRAERSLELDLAAGRQDVLGRLEIPRVGLSAIVFEGSSDSVLRRGIGHMANTARPGDHGNVALTAHRDTFFRPLRDVRADDEILLTTPQGRYRYRVESTKIVAPNDVSVLKSNGESRLTLITCYPFYFIGAAPKRFVVLAR